MSEISVIMTSDEHRAYQALTKMAEGLSKVEGGVKKITKESRDATKEQQSLANSAKKVWDDVATPMEKHKQRVLELNVLLKKNLIDQQAYNKAVSQSADSADKMAHSHSAAAGWASNQLASIKGMIAGYFSVATAINAVTAAIEQKEQVERRAKDITVTAADAQMGMLRNLGDVTEQEQNEFDQRLRDLNAKYKPKGGMAAVYAEAASGLSASQSNRARTLRAMEVAMQFAPDSAETREQIAGAVLDLRKATRSEDPLENLGLLKVIGEQSRLTDWAKIGKNLSGGVIGIQEYGGNAQQAGALIAAITQASADVEGRRSTNAAIGMVEQLDRYLPEKDKYDYRLDPTTMRMKKIVLAKGTGLTDWMSRIEYLRKNPTEMERVLGDLSAEKKQKAAIRQIIMGEGAGAEAFQSALQEMNIPLSEMKNRATTKIDLMQKPLGQQIASADRANIGAEGALAATVMGKEAAIADTFSRENMMKILDQSGWAGTNERWMRNVAWYTTRGSNYEAFQSGLQGRLETMLPITAVGQENTVETWLKNPSYREDLLKTDPARVEMIDLLIKTMQEKEQQHNRMMDELAKLTEQLKRNHTSPHPTAVQNNRAQHGEK